MVLVYVGEGSTAENKKELRGENNTQNGCNDRNIEQHGKKRQVTKKTDTLIKSAYN